MGWLRGVFGLGPSEWIDCPLPGKTVRLPRDTCRKFLAAVTSTEAPEMATMLPTRLSITTRPGFGALFPQTSQFTLGPTTGSGPVVTTVPGWQCAILTAFGFPCTAAGLAAAVARGVSLAVGGGNNGGGGNGGGNGTSVQCTGGTIRNPQTGVCEFPGSPGDVSTPGGPSGPAVGLGIFGAPAVSAFVVGEINGRPIRRCPAAGLVLGLDNLCYARGSIPRQYRKWKPDPKPPITVRDMRAIRRADGARKRVKKLGQAVGFSVKN